MLKIPNGYDSILFLDFETKSRCDLKKCGTYRYAMDPSTDWLMLSFAFGEDAPKTLIPGALNWRENEKGVLDALNNPRVLKVAHNAAFEMAIFECVWGMECDPSQWFCTLTQASVLSLPPSLGPLCDVLNMPTDKAKHKDGQRLIRLFCIPQKITKKNSNEWATKQTHPDDWAKFISYCENDVIAEREVYKMLSRWMMPRAERELYALDQTINRRGLPVDMALVDAALAINDGNRLEQMELAREVTGLDNPNSREQLLNWVRDELQIELDTLTKKDVSKLLDMDALPAHVRTALETRQQLAKTSIQKFTALKRSAFDSHNGPRVRGCFQFGGAGRTWRWAGRIFQPQNLPSGNLDGPDEIATAIAAIKSCDVEFVSMVYDNPAATLSSLIRPAIAPREGYKLTVADYASIESVMLGWGARCRPLLSVFEDGRDAYKDFATHWFQIHYSDVTKAQRKLAKPPALGCGYLLGAKGLVAYAAGFKVDMTEETAQEAVDAYRSAYPEIPEFWWAIDEAAKDAIATKQPQTLFDLKFFVDGPFLFMKLPSGRSLAYCRPKIEDLPTPWGAIKPTITYEGVDQYSRKWTRIKTHPGKLTENYIQAIARDVLAHGLKNADAMGWHIVGHVHDEIISEDLITDESKTVKALEDVISIRPDWCKNAPIRAAGWSGNFYMKD